MNNPDVAAALDAALPDEVIRRDVAALLLSVAHDGVATIELEDGTVDVPVSVPVELVTKAYFREYHADVGFGAWRVLVALGGFQPRAHGLHRARLCFATLYYDERGRRITADFHTAFG